MTLEELKRDAMRLDPARRMSFARELLESVDGGLEVESDRLWVQEAARREKAVAQNRVASIPSGDIFTGLPITTMRPVLFHPAAQRELYEATESSDLQGPGLAELFMEECLTTIEHLSESADDGAPAGKIRTHALARFPVELLYSVRDDEVVMLAVAYYLREPAAAPIAPPYAGKLFEARLLTTRDAIPVMSRWAWVRAHKVTLLVTGDGLKVGKSEIPFSDIADAQLFRMPNEYRLVIGHEGTYQQFSLRPDPYWGEQELPFPLKRVDDAPDLVRERRVSDVLVVGWILGLAGLAFAVAEKSPVAGVITLLWGAAMAALGFWGYRHTSRARVFLGATYGFGTGAVIAFIATSAGMLHLPSFSDQAVLFMQWSLGCLVCLLGVAAALILWLTARTTPRRAEFARLQRGAMIALIVSAGVMGLVALSLFGQVR